MARYKGTRSAGYTKKSMLQAAFAGIFLIAAACALFLLMKPLFNGSESDGYKNPSLENTTQSPEKPPQQGSKDEAPSSTTQVDTEQTSTGSESEGSIDGNVGSSEKTPVPEVYPTEIITYEEFNPYCTENSDPDKHMISTKISVIGNVVDSYEAEAAVTFGLPSEYTSLEGVFAFRGDNFRTGSSYGITTMTQKKFETVWKQSVYALEAPDGNTWTGVGWTGQALIVTWPKSTRAIMNMYDWAKNAETLTEVIYAAEDGNVYFNELYTGEKTRDILHMNYTFKGSGSLDPRGYPILYVGSGYDSMYGKSRAFAISLIDGSILFSFGNGDSFAPRNWSMFDASPMVDAETDTLIWPGENGVLYLVQMHLKYDEAAGTLSADPDYIKWSYQGKRTSYYNYWWGMEDSPAIWQGHLFIADNGGYLMCVDLNTLELVWVNDMLDDTNCSPVLSIEDGHPYLYMSTSFHLGWRSSNTANIPVRKIDAENGETIWEVNYKCYSADGVSGGVQGTLAVGQKQLSDYIYVPVSKHESGSGGTLACLNKNTGETVWTYTTNSYSWGSPTIVYTADGNGYVIFVTLEGSLLMLDGKTGTLLDSMNFGAHCEATVVAFNDYLVVGCRSGYIWGLKLT